MSKRFRNNKKAVPIAGSAFQLLRKWRNSGKAACAVLQTVLLGRTFFVWDCRAQLNFATILLLFFYLQSCFFTIGTHILKLSAKPP